MALHHAGPTSKNYPVAAIGFGIALYGLGYFIVHEVIIHQRFKWFTRSNNTYVRTIRWAHKMHHKHLEKEDGESFGMLWVAKNTGKRSVPIKRGISKGKSWQHQRINFT